MEMTLKSVIEALVFASPKPISTKEIVSALRGAGEGTEDETVRGFAKMKEDDVRTVLEEIQLDLEQTGRAFTLVEQVRGWSLMSKPEFAAWVRQLYPEAKPTRLSGPQLETLAIIAYRQPVTRADIEAVRGVAVDGVMQVLLDRSLVKIAGRAEVPGRPLLYETTEYFLQHFGLKSVDELPNAGELKRIALPKAPVPEESGQKVEGSGQKPEASEQKAEPSGQTTTDGEPKAEATAEQTEEPVEEKEPEADLMPEASEDNRGEANEPQPEESSADQ